MNRKYSQESSGFSENFDETTDNDLPLLNFMQQYKPVPPSPNPEFERRLFSKISESPMPVSYKRWIPWLWLIPAAIIAAIGVNAAMNRSSYQVVEVAEITDADKLAIENSLISSWDISTDNVTQASGNADSSLLQELTPLDYQ